jgi:hypothetical protein
VRTRSFILLWCFLLCSSPFLRAGIILKEPVEIPPVVVGSSLTIPVSVFIPATSQQGNVRIDSIYTGNLTGAVIFTVDEWSVRDIQSDTTIEVRITFHPRTVGKIEDRLLIPLPLDTIIVPLIGTGIDLRIAPQELVLGPIDEGQELAKDIWVYNDGNSTVTVRQNRLISPFVRDGSDSIVISALDSQKVTVHFTAGLQQNMPIETAFGEIVFVVSDGQNNNTIGIRGISYAATTRAELSFVVTPSEISQTSVYTFYNRFQEEISVQVTPILGSPGFEFIEDYKAPVRVAAGDSLRIPVRFTPGNGTAGGQTAAFRLLYDTEVTLAEVRLLGTGLFIRRIDVVADTLHASVGDTVRIPVRLVLSPEIKQVLEQSKAFMLKVGYTMAFNMSMAEVADDPSIDSIVYTDTTMVLYIGTQLALNLPLPATMDTLDINTIAVRLLLGDAERCPIIIRDMVIRTDSTTIFETDAVVNSDGLLIADNVFTWPDGQKRLVNARKGTLEMEISPNPMKDQTQIAVSGFSRDAIVTVYTPLGIELFRRICDEPLSFVLTRNDLPGLAPGIYYCRLSSGRYSLVKLLRVE